MSESYQRIKEIFAEVLDKEPIKGISINKYISKKDYIKDVYNHIIEKNYVEMRTDTTEFLKISPTQLDEYFIDIICSNLYGDLALILQIVGNERRNRNFILMELGIDELKDKLTADRIKKRLQPARINKRNKIYIRNKDNFKHSIPILIEAYKETLFVERNGTDIFDISEIFIDIFKSLFCDTDEQNKDKVYTKNIRMIKSYRLWDFTEDTVQQVTEIYKKVLESKNKYRYAELIFLEKLFSLFTVNAILSRKFKKSELTLVVDVISKMRYFGYNSMTNFIINKIDLKNHHIFEDKIDTYIYPVCSECIFTILNDIITYIKKLTSDETVELIKSFMRVCYNSSMQLNSEKMLEHVVNHPENTLNVFKKLFYLPEKATKNEVKHYLATFWQISEKIIVQNRKGTKEFFDYDMNYSDFSYLKSTVDTNFIPEYDTEEIFLRDFHLVQKKT